jgi:hypothetical protein
MKKILNVLFLSSWSLIAACAATTPPQPSLAPKDTNYWSNDLKMKRAEEKKQQRPAPGRSVPLFPSLTSESEE